MCLPNLSNCSSTSVTSAIEALSAEKTRFRRAASSKAKLSLVDAEKGPNGVLAADQTKLTYIHWQHIGNTLATH